MRALLVTVSLACAAKLAAVEPIKSYPHLVLKDGRRLVAVQVVNYTMTDVLVRHSGGATTLRGDLLPEEVAADLHLLARPIAEAAAANSAFLALAHKVAVAETQPRAKSTTAEAPAGDNFVPENPTRLTAVTAPSTSRANRMDLAGRVAIKLPTGETRLLEGVEIRAYPANLLPGYLEKALARGNEAAEKLLQQATIAASEGRNADYATLVDRARKAADQYLNLLPVAPFTARSDAHGHFTLSHELADARIVATARITSSTGELNYRWIGIPAANDLVLTEANATAGGIAGQPERPRLAAR